MTSSTASGDDDANRHRARRSRQPGPAWGWALSLLVVACGARASLSILHALDNGRVMAATSWFVVASLAEDLKLTVAFALLVAVVHAVGRGRASFCKWGTRGVAVLYVSLSAWMVINIPVARFFSSPLTYSMLHATGSAIGDSITGYVSLANVGLPIAVLLCGLGFAWWLRPRLQPPAGWLWASVVASFVLLAMAPVAKRRVETLGLHRNAVVALVETVLARWHVGAQVVRPSLSSPSCAPVDAGPGDDADLRDFVGVARGRSIVWVILESTGAPALSPYGGSGAIMPNLEALARQSLIFEHAYAAYPESIKGLFSFLCSQEPETRSEASDYAVGRVPCRSIAEQLAQAGYRTGLFHSGWFAYLGMRAVVEGRGFGTLHDASTITSPLRTSFGVDDRSTADRALAFVDSLAQEQPFFMVFMPIAGHHPYHAPGSAPRPFPDQEDRDAYANDLHVADDAFGRLREGLRARGRDERTIYVAFGDHGEAFRQHQGNIAHALFLYEENVRVPLLVAAPGMLTSSRRIPGQASLIDVAPTTLALAGVTIPRQYEGRSLLVPRPRIVRFATEQAVRRVGIRDGRWKFILNEDGDRPELYDLNADPEERRNVARANAPLVQHYLACVGR